MNIFVANLVRDRAGNCCEYCRLRQEHEPFLRFHIEHIIPKQHGGDDDTSNLALACIRCNLHKGTNLAGIDPDSGNIIPLFHPRRQIWSEHFQLRGIWINGLTAAGRTTVRVLHMNDSSRLELREDLRGRRVLD